MMLHDAGISPASTPIATRFNIPVRVCMVCLGLKVPTNLFSMSRIKVDGIVYLLICFVVLYLGTNSMDRYYSNVTSLDTTLHDKTLIRAAIYTSSFEGWVVSISLSGSKIGVP